MQPPPMIFRQKAGLGPTRPGWPPPGLIFSGLGTVKAEQELRHQPLATQFTKGPRSIVPKRLLNSDGTMSSMIRVCIGINTFNAEDRSLISTVTDGCKPNRNFPCYPINMSFTFLP